MAELVTTMVVGPLLSIVKDKAASYLLDQYKVMEGMEEQHRILTRKLPAILDVITDAEEAASHREGAKAWLLEVKRVAYEANEIFDEFSASIQAVEADRVIFDPEKIISRSRDQDTKNIVHTLLGQASNADLTVVPIVGVGGLGKTTLAQLIYNEPKIQRHFELLLWVCVSDSFDVDSLAKSIAELHPPKSTAEADSKKGPLDILQDVLRGHRYLLVLDDVWNRDPDKWEKLKSCLTHGTKGSAVLTTTRDEGIAKIMGTVKAYNLAALGDNFIKEIIETRAFSLQKEEERSSVLLNMVGEIAKRCRGSPLAATALGSVLRTKTSEEEWKAISSRSNICTEESGILPILKLSYNDLSSQMKQCFAFCAVFPKDYEIDVDKLIQLWIAHGFILQQNEVRPETIGKRIFSELASRSFFVAVKLGKATFGKIGRRTGTSYSKHTCRIHDLMHDVALSTMEKECALVPEEASQIEWLSDTTRHLLLSCEKPETILNDSLPRRSPAIQTLLCDSDMQDPVQHLSKYSSLKALQLCTSRRSFPLKSKHLHHLRYLDLSRSYIKALPEDISILYNLQTLDISGCHKLRRLPRQMKYLTALRHLYTHGCPEIRSMPGDLRKLASLQTLSCFIAGPTGSGCSDVGELQQLNLGGELELHQLENVTQEDAKAANLGKKEIQELTLKWTIGCRDDARVLEGLKPHDGLQALRISSYGGTTFPTWMVMLRNLVDMHLSNCKKVQWLFSCDTSFTFPNLMEFTLRSLECLEGWWEISSEKQGEEIIFPRLQKLSIVRCAKLSALPEAALLGESYGTMARSAFPALKELYLDELDSFQRWEPIEGTQRGHIVFPKLEKLTIEHCPVLTALVDVPFGGDHSVAPSAFPALKVLKLKYLRSFERMDVVEGPEGDEIMFPQLEMLYVIGCEKMTTLSGQQKVCPNLITEAKSPNLSVLEMQGIEEEMFLWVARHMTSLTTVKLQNCKDTETTLAVADHRFTQVVDAMEKGNHSDFPLTDMKLTGFRLGVTELCGCFVQLQSLWIDECDALVHWPENEFQSLVSLRKLVIFYCNQLVGYAQGPEAEPSTSESSRQLLPRLEYLHIDGCRNMVEVFKVPASLRRMIFNNCSKLKSIFSKRLQQGQSASPNLQGRPPVYSEVSSSSPVARTDHFLLPCLEEIYLRGCGSLPGVLDLPPSIKKLSVYRCSELRSVESHSGEFPLLDGLYIEDCKTLSSLPDGPQAYSSLRKLYIKTCPGIKRLPTCLQQRLSILEEKHVDARYEEPSLFKPQTWRNAIPRD